MHVHAKSLQSCPTLRDPVVCSLPAWDSPGKKTRVGCHVLLQGIFPTQGLNPGLLQADSLPSEPPGKLKNTGMGSLSLLQGIFLTQESNQGLLHCKQILYQLSYQGSCRESLFCSNKLRQSLAHLVSICTFITYCMCLRNHLLVRNKNTFKTVL